MWMSLADGWRCELEGAWCADIVINARLRRWLSKTRAAGYVTRLNRARARESIAAPKWRGVYR
jgi:hypothetical protein